MLEYYDRVDINERDQKGNTPLMLAARMNNVQAVQSLLENKRTDILAKNEEGCNFIQIALKCNAKDVVE